MDKHLTLTVEAFSVLHQKLNPFFTQKISDKKKYSKQRERDDKKFKES